MDVHAPEPRNGQHVGRQDHPVGNDRDRVRRHLAQPIGFRDAAQRLRLDDLNAELRRRLLDRRRRQLASAPARLVRARVHGGHIEGLRDGAQGRNGGVRRPHEDDAHAL